MEKKKAVLFDLDGTLINSLPDIARCMNRALKENGLPEHPEAAYRYFVGDGAVNLTRRAAGPEQAARYEDVLACYSALYAVHCRELSHVYPGIPALLCDLRDAGLRLAVLSNKDQGDVESVLRYYFPDAPFEIMRGRRPGVPIKPDPAAALAIAADMGLSPADFWYLGDTPTDCRTCQNAGMRLLAVGWGFRPEEELRNAGAEIVAMTPREAGRIMLKTKE